jgi:hypothetical protein
MAKIKNTTAHVGNREIAIPKCSICHDLHAIPDQIARFTTLNALEEAAHAGCSSCLVLCDAINDHPNRHVVTGDSQVVLGMTHAVVRTSQTTHRSAQRLTIAFNHIPETGIEIYSTDGNVIRISGNDTGRRRPTDSVTERVAQAYPLLALSHHVSLNSSSAE